MIWFMCWNALLFSPVMSQLSDLSDSRPSSSPSPRLSPLDSPRGCQRSVHAESSNMSAGTLQININASLLSADLTAAGHEDRLRHADVSVWEDGQRHQGVHQHTAGGAWRRDFHFRHSVLPCCGCITQFFLACSCAVPSWTRPEAGGPQDHPVCVSGTEGPEQRLVPPVAGGLPVTANKTVREFRMLRPKKKISFRCKTMVSPDRRLRMMMSCFCKNHLHPSIKPSIHPSTSYCSTEKKVWLKCLGIPLCWRNHFF